MSKKINRLVKGLGFFSIVIGLVFVGLVYALKKDLMIAEIGKLFNYAVDFMFNREWTGKVLTGNLFGLGAIAIAATWIVVCVKKKKVATGIFGGMGVLGGTVGLLLMYRYRKSLISNAELTPGLGKAIHLILVFFLLLMALNVVVSVLGFFVNDEENKEIEYKNKSAKVLNKISNILFVVFVVALTLGVLLAFAFKFEGLMVRAPKFYHYVLDLINIANWEADMVVANFTVFLLLLAAASWLLHNILKKKLSVGPVSMAIGLVMLAGVLNYKDTFAFYLDHPSVYLHIVVYVVYALMIIVLASAATSLVSDCMYFTSVEEDVDVINVKTTDETKNTEVEVKEETEEKVEEVKEEVVETTEEEVEETVELGDDLIEVIDENNKKLIINKRLYTNKLCLADDELKKNYNIIKNAIMKYNKVRSRISANYESFRKGRKLLVRFNILGKTLRVYLALNPEEYPVTVYHQRNEGDKKKYELVPLMLRVRSPRSVRNAVKLIDELMEKEGLALVKDFVEVDYAKDFKYDSNALLIKDGFKNLVREEIDEAHADELSDDEAMRVVVNKVVEEPEINPDTKVVEKRAKVNKAIVNVDQINQVFDHDEYVDLAKMKEKGLVSKKTNYVKVLSRGVINKPMTIEADEFSLKAVKMIVLTGGSVVKLVTK